jgi:3-deoxy-D-manno-octulosonic-acid transferase
MFFYSVLLSAGLAASAPWWVARLFMTARYREGLRERLGRVPDRIRNAVAGQQVVWFHAVSVGEVLAAAGLIRELEASLAEGGDAWKVVVSTTTLTGQTLARERFGAERVFWFPLDFAWTVRAWLRVLCPRMVVLVESELWPRLLAECHHQRIPVAVVNARMSDRSFRRAMRFRRLWERVLRSVSLFLAQGEETASRLRRLGVAEGALRLAGNLKYDLEPPRSAVADALRPLLHRCATVVAGSLLPQEDTVVLEAWRGLLQRAPQSVLVVAPRHPQRFESVAQRIQKDFTLYRASELGRKGDRPPLQRLEARAVILLDTVGDLATVYGLADVAFVGGSLVRKGGHNPLEPARFGVPVLMGQSFENFREIVAAMQRVNGIRLVHDGKELEATLADLLTDHLEADALGQRGRKIFDENCGATRRTVQALRGLLQNGVSA